ncbi:MAG: hypothetical protein MUE60_15460 [Candidatus Eisenbacteria bacterium]|jgi:anti-sigma factor RsiW|nr:hypothetical protein [Candidatus Eisenbacteria bacterium]
MSSRTNHVADYTLEKYALGELPKDQLDALARRIETEPDLAARLKTMASSNIETLKKYPPAWFAAEVAARAAKPAPSAPTTRPFRFRSSLVALVPVLSAMALALWVLRPANDVSPPIPGLAEIAETRIKGLEPRLAVYRKRGDEVERIDSATVVQRGDVLQLSYVAAGRRHGVIVSVDGRGSTTLHFPREGGSTTLSPQGETPIPHAYEIDDAPEFERFILVTASSPIDVAAVVGATEALAGDPIGCRSASLALPDSLEQWAVLVQKKEVRQ